MLQARRLAVAFRVEAPVTRRSPSDPEFLGPYLIVGDVSYKIELSKMSPEFPRIPGPCCRFDQS